MDAAENGQTPVKRVLLAGATGYIGRFVARELVRRHYEVVTIVRETAASKTAQNLEELRAQLPGCDVRVASITDPAQLAAALSTLCCCRRFVSNVHTSRSSTPSSLLRRC